MTTEPKQERSRRTRQSILDAAVVSLANRGWNETTVGLVAADAGTSRGALQHHFPTREDLTLAALHYMFEQRSRLLREFRTPEGVEGAEKVGAVVDQLAELFTGITFRAALPVWTAAAVDDDLRDRVLELERRFGQDVHERTIEMLGADGSDPAVRRLVEVTLDLLRGLGLANILSDDSKRRSRVIETWLPHLTEGLDLP
ncbi:MULTISPECIES: TetR/AcrR family transcriptional regulator [Dermacoccus]|uniref:TetR/AcrR family transcriptional regulator n=1 Tax=Dermacoccus TaxID=57495 RepID=UPI00101DC124|nr:MULTISPECIES: TetR/AcrR family transcriptional regulator [Dermacoccus]MBE7371472.1 TetR/AcrR family transcriptional regulator [Dermacoccus barathri]RYI22422.1 TetR/AcrR family transcriptional regulator [Dermacoccus sp. 147Ba]